MKHLLNWVLSAVALWIVANLVPGFHLTGPFAALIAALVIGFVNATLGVFLKIVTFPLTLLTLGIFWLGQQAQLDRLARSDRDLAWIHIAFLCAVTLVPFSTALLAEHIAYRVALVVY